MSELPGTTQAEEEILCATPGCGKPALMACPTCIKLEIPPSRFCTQECFKSHWNVHKELHKQAKLAKIDVTKMPREFGGYNFSGPLRPYYVTPKRKVGDDIMKPDYAIHPTGESASERADKKTNHIPVYKPEEIAGNNT